MGINELEIALDHANKANNEALKSIKRYQGQLREADCLYEEASRVRQEMAEKASLADRRANSLQGEMEESRALFDSAERGKRQTEAELGEARSAVNEMTTVNSRELRRDVLKALFTQCKQKLMICFTRPRTLKKKPRKLWWMLQDLQMNLELSKIMFRPTLEII